MQVYPHNLLNWGKKALFYVNSMFNPPLTLFTNTLIETVTFCHGFNFAF